jgi:hypothetical protein
MASLEVKIDKIAMLLPANEWFTKVQFSELTGINFKSCTMRLNKIIDKKMLIVDRTKKKCFYMMTERCFRLMMITAEENKKERLAILDKGRRLKPVINNNFDKLLFSTKFF